MSSQANTQSKSLPQVRRGAKALITATDRVLLVKESRSNGTQFWTLPGGGVEPHESPSSALQRELAEELCCRVSVGEQIASFWYAHTSCARTVSVYTVFDCGLVTPTVPNQSEGVLDVRWVRPASLPAGTVLGVRTLIEHCTGCGNL